MNVQVCQRAWWSGLTAAAILLAAGCDMSSQDPKEQAQNPYPEEFLRKEWPQSKSMASRTVYSPYQIREGDKLEIIYFVKTYKALEEDYKIKIRDVVSVRFPFNKDLDVDTAEVQSDGTIYLPLINRVNVFGHTMPEVQSELERLYSKYLQKPVLTASLQKSKREIDDLREAITTSPRGQSRLVPVTPGGQIALPLIGSVRAGGLTVDEVQKAIEKKYQILGQGLYELQVTVNLETISPLRVYVLGEVQRPGIVFNTLGGPTNVTQMTLLAALSSSGSYIPGRADLSKVVLIRNNGLPTPDVAVINLYQLFENKGEKINGKKRFVPNRAKFRHDIWLTDGDIVYVPTMEIAKRADFIEYVWTRGVYAVVPMSYSISANYNAVDDVDWLGPNPSNR
jgi:polysaccharide export outer membrane protein